MARIDRRRLRKLSGAGAVAAGSGGLAGILASGRAPAFAQATSIHWVRWSDFVPASDKAVLGSWEGDSNCTVPDSPCHDEHVLYQIAVDKKDPFQLNLDGYKVVEGAPEFMGTLACRFESKTAALSCTSSTKDKDDWEFRVVGDTMSGRLMIDQGKTLYRRITLRRVPK